MVNPALTRPDGRRGGEPGADPAAASALTRLGHRRPRWAAQAGHTTGMPCLMLRTLVVAPWLLALLIHAEAGLIPVVLALALVSVWAVPLARDCRRTRTTVPVRIAGPGRG